MVENINRGDGVELIHMNDISLLLEHAGRREQTAMHAMVVVTVVGAEFLELALVLFANAFGSVMVGEAACDE